MGKRSQRQRRQARRTRSSSCGFPGGCVELATHVVEEPVFGGSFQACDEHWPDLVGLIWSEGGTVTACPCSECIRQGVSL